MEQSEGIQESLHVEVEQHQPVDTSVRFPFQEIAITSSQSDLQTQGFDLRACNFIFSARKWKSTEGSVRFL